MRITVVYDNDAVKPFVADWGFSCLVEGRETLLFDTGANPNILEHNLSLVGINDFDYIFLSHEHYDHVGGLKAVIDKTSYVVIPKTFSKRLKEYVSSKAEVIEVVEPFRFGDFVSTGILGRVIKEQALIVDNLLITGCSHPGLDKVIRKAEELGKISSVMGGFHDFGRIELLRGYDIVIPCHCTIMKKEILKMGNAKPYFAGCSFEV